MDVYLNNSLIQLERTLKLTGGRWAVWLKINDSIWAVLLQAGLTKIRRREIEDYLWEPGNKAWIAGALSSGRVRSRQVSETATPLSCPRIYVFPNSLSQTAIIVGGNLLTKDGQEFYKILALLDPYNKSTRPGTDFEDTLNWPKEFGSGVPNDPEKIFNWIIQVMSKSLPINAGYLAIRVGNFLSIESQWNYDPIILGSRIPIFSARELRLIQATLHGIISPGPVHFPEFVKAGNLSFSASSFLSIPVLLGQRLIGMMVLASANPQGLNTDDQERAALILERLAHAVESAIIFKDIARYLQQFILLSELASAVTVESEPAQIARRLVRRLSRTFHTEQVAVWLVSSDGKYLKEFGSNHEASQLVIPISESMLGYVVENGVPYRTGDITSAPRFYGEEAKILSMVAAPLKYQGRIIGVIGIECLKREAFTAQDEQLLVVIASQLAGMLENVRLMQETGERARNLSMIHQVLGKVVGLVDIREIASVTTGLVAEFFKHSLACIFLPDNPGKQLCLVGVGGMQEAKPEVGFLLPIDQGIPGYVYQSGISYFSNEGSTHSGGHSRNQWAAAAELAVPLRSGDQILGVIDCQRSANNTFSQDDLLIMESLAGILASVIIHARRYQERQQTISQLELVRETALDISNLELDKLIERVVRRARQLVKAPGAELGLFEPENDRVRVLATNNPWYLLEAGARPLGIGVTGRIAQSGKPLAITDYNTWEGRLFPDQPHPCTAVAGVPLMIKGEVIGTLIVMDDVPGRIFTTEDLNLLELLAPQVAVSIRNARLYQELQERIKAQKMAERQLLQSARMAAVGEMAAGVAHELNNPLTTVSGFVELALEELPSDLPQRAELELVLAEAHRAQTVVRRLLDFSHQSDHPSFLINPNTLLDDLLPLIQHQIHGTDIRIHMNCQEAVKKILVEPNQIKQVLLNLVQNAIQAMPTGGDLIISTLPMDYQDHPGTVFSIQDSGEGISPEHLDRLFEPFFTTRSVGSGTGLGLSVSYGIVTDHKGIILVDSQIGNGSTFRVWFPVNNSIQLESKSNEPV